MALNTFHRQIGKLQKRSEDKIDIALVITEFNQIESFTDKLIANSKGWRDAWTDILVFQTQIAHSYQDIYQNAFGDSSFECTNTPMEKLQQVSTFYGVLDELRLELAQDMNQLERSVIDPLIDIKDAFKPIHKALKKRENKKLDYERYQKQVDHARGKRSRSDRENKAMAKAERDLELAVADYQNHDEKIIGWLPPLLQKAAEALPLILEVLTACQVAVLARSYTVLLEYAQSQGIELSQAETVVQDWEEKFSPIQRNVETNLVLIARGKAVMTPMNQLSAPKTSMVQKVLPSRLKKGPPPPPPSNPPAGAKPMLAGRVPSAGSVPTPIEQEQESSLKTPARPLISRASTSALRSYKREESPPPPPLPGNKPPPPSSFSKRPASSYSATSMASTTRQQPGGRAVSGHSTLSLPGQPGVDLLQVPRLRSTTPHSDSGGNNADLTAGIEENTDSSFANARAKFSGAINGNSSNGNLAVIAAQLQNTRPVLKPTGSNYASSIVSNSPSIASTASTVVGKKKPPPPPKKKFVMVTALYNFDGQVDSDLTFKAGDKIKVLRKTDSLDDWWEGELDGRRGEFPANYTTSGAQ